MKKINFEYRFIAAYLIIGGLWILFSDRLLASIIKDADSITRIQTYKGWFYVLITALLFYSLLKRHLVKLRNAEKKAVESDRLKTAFLQNISHEIRTPMNSIVGFSELLREPETNEKEKEEYLDMISRSSDQLLNIVNEVLDISLIETGNITLNYRNIHLNHLMDELYLIFKPLVFNGVSFSYEKGLSEDLSYIETDVTKVRQVLNNLLSNAFKFTERGYIRFGYTLVEDDLQFFVEDSGIGIDSTFHDKIFERFLKIGHDEIKLYEGVGLGLAICKGNVDLLKGKIWFESEPGKGSRFFFTIPYKQVYSDKQAPSLRTLPAEELRELVILVAEDDEVNFKYINEIFRASGAKILHAVNGREAVDMSRDNDKIDIVLIDIKMPVMNGYEAIKQIRKLRPGLPIIAQTAFALSNEMLKAFNAGCNDYISKPFSKEQLLAIVAKNRSVKGPQAE